MPTLRSSNVQAPINNGASSIARPTGLQTTDVVVLFAVTDQGSGITFTAPGFTTAYAGAVPGDVSVEVLVGTGFAAGGTFTVTPSDLAAWVHLTATAWTDADTALIAGSAVVATQPAVIPAITTTRPGTIVMPVIAMSYSAVSSISSGTLLSNIGDGSHGWVYSRGPQAVPGSSGTVTFETSAPWFAALGVQIGIQPGPAAVASHSAHSPGGSADRGVSAPSGLADGDALLVIANTDGVGTDLGISGPGTWTKLAAAPSAVPGLHAFVATDVAAADGPWTLTGATGEWIHRIAIRITNPGDVLVGGHYNGVPGSTPPNWDAAIVPSADAPADDTLCIVAGYVINGVDTDPSTTAIANTGALAARWRYVDEGPTGTLEWSPSNIWTDVTVERIMVTPAGGGGDHRTTSGSLALTLATGGAGSKSAGVVGSVDLGIGTASPGAAKEGHTDGSVGADLDVVALGVKSAPVAGEVDIAVAVTAAAITDRAAEGTVNVDVAVVGDTSKASLAASALNLALDIAGDSTKATEASAALNLALDLAADTEKAAAVAGSLGIILDITGTGQAHSPGETDGHLALALAAVAVAVKAAQTAGHPGVIFDLTGTAEKHATTSGALAVALDTVGATVPDEDDVTGLITLGLSVTGTASKQTGTVGTVALVVALAGRARRLGVVLPPARGTDNVATRATADTTSRASADAYRSRR